MSAIKPIEVVSGALTESPYLDDATDLFSQNHWSLDETNLRGYHESTISLYAFSEAGVLAGVALVMLSPPRMDDKSALLTRLMTAPEFRKKGVASNLLLAAADQASLRAKQRLWLVCSPALDAFYQKRGFVCQPNHPFSYKAKRLAP